MNRDEAIIKVNLPFISGIDEFMYGYTEFMIAIDGDSFFKYFYRATQIYESDAKQWKGRKRGADSIFAKEQNKDIPVFSESQSSEYDLAHHLWNKYVTTYDRDYGRFFRGMDTSNRMKVLIAMLLWYADHRATYSKDPYYAAIYSLIGAI